jgi:hypothetical protein
MSPASIIIGREIRPTHGRRPQLAPKTFTARPVPGVSFAAWRMHSYHRSRRRQLPSLGRILSTRSNGPHSVFGGIDLDAAFTSTRQAAIL